MRNSTTAFTFILLFLSLGFMKYKYGDPRQTLITPTKYENYSNMARFIHFPQIVKKPRKALLQLEQSNTHQSEICVFPQKFSLKTTKQKLLPYFFELVT